MRDIEFTLLFFALPIYGLVQLVRAYKKDKESIKEEILVFIKLSLVVVVFFLIMECLKAYLGEFKPLTKLLLLIK